MGTNSSGVKELNFELPYKFKNPVSLSDNAYGMNYTDSNATNVADEPANILYSAVNNDGDVSRIFGHVNYHGQTSYNIYAFTVIGEIAD